MTSVDIFRDVFLPNVQDATVTYDKWVRQQPGEYSKWLAYRDAVLSGKSVTPPQMSTRVGKMLVAAGQMAVSSPPQPIPPSATQYFKDDDAVVEIVGKPTKISAGVFLAPDDTFLRVK